MSRVGRAPISFEKTVQVNISPENLVTVKGPKVSESVHVRPEIKVNVADGTITLTRKDDSQTSRSLHGLSRALLQNAVTGVTTGFTKTLELVGVGYRAQVAGKKLELTLGFSHPIKYEIPDGITMKVDKNTTLHVSGSSKEKVGQVAAKIRDYRKPEPFLGKGVKYKDEYIRRKAGKAGAKK
jgi:large subunit ribosomal protein L6